MLAGVFLVGCQPQSLPPAPLPSPAPQRPAALAPAPLPAGTVPSVIAPFAPVPAAISAAPHPDDDAFATLREAARASDAGKAEALAARLAQYPIPSYVDYYRLKPRLASAAPDEVRSFLARYAGSAIAERMRNDWLLELGKVRNWSVFDEQYRQMVPEGDLQVRCYGLMARIARGERVATAARELLVSPPAYGEACNGLLVALSEAGQFEADDLLAQLRLAGETASTGPARRSATLLGASGERAAQAVDYPALVIARGVGATRAEREIYLVAVSRMARTSVPMALMPFRRSLAAFTAQEQATGWAVLAHAASLKLEPEAWTYWKQSAGAPLTAEQMQWKTRIALRQGDWQAVRAAIDAMPTALSSQVTWTYWRARSLQASPLPPGQSGEAPTAIYQRIADQNTFYGQLAIEEIGRKISIPQPPPAVTAAELAPMALNPGLRRALKLFSLRMRPEGMREWNWETRNMGERELIAAAEFARRADILDRMVYTSERTRTMFDYSQRFPAPHSDILGPTTAKLGLDKAWVYGLIRQESRFIMDARSSAGASGLMQVMPETAKLVARKLGLGDYARDKLNDLHMNLLLGSNYLNMVLVNSGGSQPLASAAYNAGPGRMRRWRAALPGTMEGAIFAESIPFMETRIYVKNVMANATNYAALFDNRPQSLKARLGQISPSAAQSTDLP